MSAVERIYLDLDTILDTRLGTLAKHNQTLATQVLSGPYHERDMDEFPGLSREEFMKLYAQRDIHTLLHSVRTNIFALMHSISRSQLETNAMGGSFDQITYVVNVHPYDLTAEEMEQMRSVIELVALDTYPVEMVRLTDKELTPKFCKSEYAMMVRYHWGYWIDMHKDAFLETQMPGVTLMAPATYERRPDLAALKAAGNMHPFHALEVSVAPIVGLRLMPVSMFSIYDGIKVQPEPDPDAKATQTSPAATGGA
jgi:hypothetical protein